MSHQAAFIPEKFGRLQVSSTPTTTPDANSVLIRTRAVAINPIDHIVQSKAFIVNNYPAILGSDASGTIEEVGSSVTRFKKGDRVLVATVYLMTGNKENGAFQELILAPEVAVSKIPESISFARAAVLPLSLATAVAGLYTQTGLKLPLPSLTRPKSNGKKLLIWGGASSVGSSVIQLAVSSGLEVVVTASPKNFDYVQSLAGGKCKVFDYKSPGVVGDLVDELADQCVGVYDDVADAPIGDKIAISTRDTQLACATVLAQLGGGKIAAVQELPTNELPATVESFSFYAPSIFFQDKAVGQAVFGEFLAEALESGQIVPAPDAEVVGNGLGSIQAAIDKYTAGVSAKKLVIEL